MSREYNTDQAATSSSHRRSPKSILISHPSYYNAGFAPPCCCCCPPDPPCVRSCILIISNRPFISIHTKHFEPATHLISTLLHSHLPLHLLHLLLLTKRQRPRHTQQQRARAHHPQRLARQAQTGGGVVVGGGGGVGDGFSVGRGDDVFKGAEAVEEGFVKVGCEGVGVGDVGFYEVCERSA